MINFISPYRSDKNIGKANNDCISRFDNNDWIVLTDHDACWLLPQSGTHIAMIIEERGANFDLIGCVTNRLSGTTQLYNGMFDSVCNAYDCYDDAKEAWERFGTLVDPIDKIAGVCMIFKVSTWLKAGGFKENSRMADIEFCKSVKRSGGKIGLAKGLYIMHNYRLWETEMKKAKTNFKHLVK